MIQIQKIALLALMFMTMKAQAAPDVLGVSFGMTPDQVAKTVRTFASEKRIQPSILTMQLSARDPATGRPVDIPNGKFVARYSLGEAAFDNYGSDGQDQLNINFSPIPGNERAAAIYRRLGFVPGQAPLAANLKDDLRKKYGPPSFETPSTQNSGESELLWSFDTAGQSVAQHGGQRCLVQLPTPTGYVSNPTAPEQPWERPITAVWGSTDAFYRACGTSLLRVRIIIDRNLGTATRMFVSYLAVKDVVSAQTSANELMRRADESAKKDAMKGAGQVKSTRL